MLKEQKKGDTTSRYQWFAVQKGDGPRDVRNNMRSDPEFPFYFAGAKFSREVPPIVPWVHHDFEEVEKMLLRECPGAFPEQPESPIPEDPAWYP